MVNRRDVVSGGLFTGLAALTLPGSAAAAEQERDRDDKAVAEAIDRLRSEVVKAQECTLGPCGMVATIRMQQNVYLRANQKFPDYIDAGLEAWEAVYDWHVKKWDPLESTCRHASLSIL